jgi:hypothetical protein
MYKNYLIKKDRTLYTALEFLIPTFFSSLLLIFQFATLSSININEKDLWVKTKFIAIFAGYYIPMGIAPILAGSASMFAVK